MVVLSVFGEQLEWYLINNNKMTDFMQKFQLNNETSKVYFQKDISEFSKEELIHINNYLLSLKYSKNKKSYKESELNTKIVLINRINKIIQ